MKIRCSAVIPASVNSRFPGGMKRFAALIVLFITTGGPDKAQESLNEELHGVSPNYDRGEYGLFAARVTVVVSKTSSGKLSLVSPSVYSKNITSYGKRLSSLTYGGANSEI